MRRTSRRRSPAKCLEPLEPRLLLAAATVTWTDVRQTIDGFGASSAWMWGSIPATALAQLYSPTSGAGLSLLRNHITPHGWTSEWEMMQQAAAFGVRSWSTPWSPPREWKTNHDNANGGSLDPSHYQDYATLLADYVQDVAAKGIPLYAISLQNEPNWTADYESCRWTAQQFANFLPFVGQTFAARGITTKIMLPEELNWDFSLAATVMANASVSQYVGLLAAHNYAESTSPYTPATIANGLPVWETETYSHATGELNTAIDTADDIYQALTNGNASAYHYWWLNTSSASGGLMDGSWNPTKRLWAMGQYSRFVRPGWVRIGQTNDGGLDITTFKDPVSGKFAFVVVNTSTANAVTETFTLSGFSASSVTPYITSSTDNLAQYAAVALTGGTSFSYTLPANSIITFYGQNAAAPALQAPTNFSAAPVYNNTTSQIVLSWSDNSSSESAYTVERSADGTTWTVLTTSLAANTLTYTDTGRTENSRYYYRVKPTNGDSTTYSPIASVSTLLKAQNFWNFSGARLANGIKLSWNFDSPVATGTTLDRSLDGLTWTPVVTLSTRATTYTDTVPGYNASQIYFYRLRNTVGSVTSAYTFWNTGLTTPALSAAQVNPYSVRFSWNNPTLGASGATIEQLNTATNTWSRVSPSSLLATDGGWTLTGLQPATAYTFRLYTSAQADFVDSATSNLLTFTTLAAPLTPAAWYKADESSGSSLADSTGYGNTASLTGTFNTNFTFSPGVGNNALRFTSGAPYASLPTGIVSSFTDFTIASWVKIDTLATWSRIFNFGTGTSSYMFLTPRANSTGGPLRFAITTSGGNGEKRLDGPVLSANTWYHIAITLSASAATLYINGASYVTNTSLTLSPASLGSTTQNYLGKSQFSSDPALLGSIDDFRIYGRALSASEVLALAKPTIAQQPTPAGNPGPTTGITLSALASDAAAPESVLTYSWALTGSNPSTATFSANNTNSAKLTTVSFSSAGIYALKLSVTNPVTNLPVSSQTLTLTAALPGDANLDNQVDLADYDLWYANVGTLAPSYTKGDFNLDHQIDLADYDLWFTHVGSTGSLTALVAPTSESAPSASTSPQQPSPTATYPPLAPRVETADVNLFSTPTATHPPIYFSLHPSKLSSFPNSPLSKHLSNARSRGFYDTFITYPLM